MLHLTKYGEVTRIDSARTLLGRGRYWTTAYLVDGLLIDSGCAHTADEFLCALDGEPIQRLVNTHTHEDHIGANGRLQRERGIPIFAHPKALAVLADPHGEQPLQFYRKLLWGWPEASYGEALHDGQIIRTAHFQFQVVYTPGHSPDHLCLYEPVRQWLFSGDLFVGGEDRALGANYDIWGILRSLKHVSGLPLDTLFPGCARVRENPQHALAAKIDHLESLGQHILDLHAADRSVPSIAQEVCGGPMWIERLTQGHFSRENLVRSYLSHAPD
jgi:glyoxylase-like metal-dependent hydrolase (beta-lactamase superfamily II)